MVDVWTYNICVEKVHVTFARTRTVLAPKAITIFVFIFLELVKHRPSGTTKAFSAFRCRFVCWVSQGVYKLVCWFDFCAEKFLIVSPEKKHLYAIYNKVINMTV